MSNTVRAELIAEKHLTPCGRYLTNRGARAVNETLAKLPTLTKMFAVFVREPDLTAEGYDNPASADFLAARVRLFKAVDEFERAVRWLEQVPRTQTPRAFSYKLKHEAEHWAGGYVSPGAFLAAALHLGIPVERIPNSHNARVGVGKRR